jgi:hypothetical protein
MAEPFHRFRSQERNRVEKQVKEIQEELAKLNL